MPIQDLYYKSMYATNRAAAGGIPKIDNVLVNGTQKSASGGKYNVTPLTKNKKHRLRLINTSVDMHIYVSLDSHTMQVIEADFVPIKPYNTTWLFIGIGQRYDVIINANQTAGDYWFRTSIASGCGSLTSGVVAGKSIFRYDLTSTADPTTTAATQPLTACADEKLANLVPFVSKPVPTFSYNAPTELLPFAGPSGSINNVAQWTVNTSSMNVDWSRPTLEYVIFPPS
jgi:FtsP/CotA-like multicopper oxidase with cupredoxin domain